MDGFDFDLQPTIYKLEKERPSPDPYTTDFEITVRDQTDYQLTIDLAQSSLHLPEMTEATNRGSQSLALLASFDS